jgi:hypothetical protein
MLDLRCASCLRREPAPDRYPAPTYGHPSKLTRSTRAPRAFDQMKDYDRYAAD